MSRYRIEIEIYEGEGGQLKLDENKVVYPDLVGEGICAWMYRGDGERSYETGLKFSYPEDADKLCPWLHDSLRGIIEALSEGQTLDWQYDNTPYVKEMDPEGITTEFVRCIDPTASGIVVKVIRTKLSD